MSIPVELADIPARMADFGAAFLVTTSGEAVKVVHAAPTYDATGAGVLVVAGPGGGSLRNATDRPSVTLLWPPLDPPGLALIVDGTAEVVGDDLRVTPTSAILHKPRP